VVIVPAWKESPAYQQLLSQCEEFLVHHLPLEQGKHWYAEGTQHRRKGSFRVASFDTSILFYQNEAAKATWEIEDGLLQSLKQAFCQDPGIMDKLTKTLPKRTIVASHRVHNQSDHASKHPTSSTIAQKEAIATRESPKVPSKKKKKKGDKKRIFSNTQEESQAQLDLLHSLGLAESDEPSDRAGIVDSNEKTQKKKKRTQR
jgi:phosphorylated CTD-interacting factor 1